jgi:hypothetical protein
MSRPIAAACLLSFLALSSTERADGASAAVTPIGSFGAIRTNGEHCDGQSIELWKCEQSILGVLHSCAGLIDTKRTSVIANQHYDQDNGAVDFTASLSVGTDYLGAGKEIPSQDEWVFRGRLRGKILSGVLTMTDKNYPKAKPRTATLSLQQQPKSLPSFANSDAWTQWATAVSSEQP